MADREIVLRIVVDNTEATQKLKDVERSVDAVTDAAGPGERALRDLQSQLGKLKTEASALNPKVRETADVLEVARRNSVSVATSTVALTGALTGAVAILGVTEAGIIAVSKAYADQSGIMKAHERGILAVSNAWRDFRVQLGEAIIGGGRDLNGFLDATARGLRGLGDRLAESIRNWRAWAAAIPGGQAAINVADIAGFFGGMAPNTALQQRDPVTGAWAPTAAGYLQRNRDRMASLVGYQALATPGVPDDLNALLADLKRGSKSAADGTARLGTAATKAAVVIEELPAYMRAEFASRMAVADRTITQLQQSVFGNGYGGTISVAVPSSNVLIPSSPLPGGGMVVLTPSVSGTAPGFQGVSFGSRLGSAFGAIAPAAIQGIFNGGNVGATLGGLGGGALGTVLGGSVSGAVGGALGATLGSVVPVIGTLAGAGLGKLLGGLFGGPTAKAKEDAAIQPQINSLIAGVTQLYGGLAGVKTMGEIVGVALADAFGSKGAAGLAHLTQLADQFKTQTDRLQDALEKYGLTWEDLGEKAKKFFFEADAQNLLQDYNLLTQAGVEQDKLLTKMAGSWNALVQTAQQNSLQIPNAMRPMLDRLVELGLLLDAAGNKIENLDTLFAQVNPDPIVIDVEYRYPSDTRNDNGDPTSTAYMTGGLVRDKGITYAARGGYLRGTDSVLAALTPGEFVMSREAVRRVGPGALHAINSGAGGLGGAVVINVDARDAVLDGISAERLADKIGRVLMDRARSKGIRLAGVGA